MKVILNSDVENLGYIGSVVNVKRGYARNYLIPNKLALYFNKHNLDIMEARKKKIEAQIKESTVTAEDLKAKIDAIVLEFHRRAGEKENLFGSVTISDILEELDKKGIKLEKKKIQLSEAIKKLGEYSCKVKLFRDISAEFKVIVKSEEQVKKEAEEALKTEEQEESLEENKD